MKNIISCIVALIMLAAQNVMALERSGTLTANGKTSGLKYAVAYETEAPRNRAILMW